MNDVIDLNYLINVYDLMMLDLPRPTPKNHFVEDGVEIPIILVDGEDD